MRWRVGPCRWCRPHVIRQDLYRVDWLAAHLQYGGSRIQVDWRAVRCDCPETMWRTRSMVGCWVGLLLSTGRHSTSHMGMKRRADDTEDTLNMTVSSTDRMKPPCRHESRQGGFFLRDGGQRLRYCVGVMSNQRLHARVNTLCSAYPSWRDTWAIGRSVPVSRRWASSRRVRSTSSA